MPHARPCISCGALLPEGSKCAALGCQSYYHTAEWRAIRAGVVKDGCAVCGSAERVAAHHRTARRDGGPDDASNLVALCEADHNAYEGDKRAGRDTPLRRIVEAL